MGSACWLAGCSKTKPSRRRKCGSVSRVCHFNMEENHVFQVMLARYSFPPIFQAWRTCGTITNSVTTVDTGINNILDITMSSCYIVNLKTFVCLLWWNKLLTRTFPRSIAGYNNKIWFPGDSHKREKKSHKCWGRARALPQHLRFPTTPLNTNQLRQFSVPQCCERSHLAMWAVSFQCGGKHMRLSQKGCWRRTPH